MKRPPIRLLRPAAWSLVLILWVCAVAGAPAWADEPPPATQPTAIMPLEEIRPGMTGYGLTVFQGTRIEPFAVEVLSVVHNANPRHSIIWIRCPDPRMQKLGPVQGMSGSPIYLWDEGEPHELGRGGRLIGAFALGYTFVKDCLAGVQPIQYMREVGQRVDHEPQPPRVASGAAAAVTAQAAFERMAQLAQTQGLSPQERLRLDGLRELLKRSIDPLAAPGVASPSQAAGQTPPPPPGLDVDGQGVPLRLPLPLGSAQLAQLFDPLLEPMGLTSTGGGFISGPPPAGVDVDGLRLEPGSVLAVPLVFGDLDLSAAGTVTDVLPDGTVLGFGHAMFGQGAVALPMATGYVHFVVPHLQSSFKLAGGVAVQGSLLRDETSAVAGSNGQQEFATAPFEVEVHLPNQPQRTYSYELVEHQELTPILAAIVTLRSLTAVQDLPTEHTLRLQGQLHLEGQPPIQLNSMLPQEGAFGVLFELLPPLTLLMQNPHQPLRLTDAQITATVEPKVLSGTVVNARLDRSAVEPGQKLGLTVWVQPHGQSIQRHRVELEVPATLAEGDYALMVMDAPTYLMQMMASRPHLFVTRDVGELVEMVQRVLSIRRDAIYITLQGQQETGVAVGRQELPQLPSSRRAMIFTPDSSTIVTPYVEAIEKIVPTDVAVTSQLPPFTVSVRRDINDIDR
ncbi:MAG TPA: hypothetical protein VF184_01665 [Phycisphaeraceae bacterium]